MRRLLLSVIVALLVLAAPRVEASYLPQGWEVLESTAERLRVRIELPEASLSRIESEGRQYVRVDVPGYRNMGDSGQPMFPAQGSWVALPPVGEPTLSVRVLETRALGSGRVLPYPTPVPQRHPPGELEHVLELHREGDDYASYRNDRGTVARLGQITWSRKQRMVPLEVRPLLHDARSGRLELAQTIEIIIDFPSALLGEREAGDSDPIALSTVINPEAAGTWRSLAPRQRALKEAWLQRPELRKGAAQVDVIAPLDPDGLLTDEYRLRVPNTGLVRVRMSELFNDHGFPSGIERNRLRLYQRRPAPEDHPAFPIPLTLDVPFHFIGEPDPNGELSINDELLFYGFAARDDTDDRDVNGEVFPTPTIRRADDFNNYNVYWLAAADPGAGEWARMEIVDLDPASSAVQTSFPWEERFEQDTGYQENPVNTNQPRYHWNDFRETLVRKSLLVRPLDPSSPIDVRYTMVSHVNVSGLNPTPLVDVTLEQDDYTQLIGTRNVNPFSMDTLTEYAAVVPAGQVESGFLIFQLERNDDPGNWVLSWIGSIKLTYEAQYEAFFNEAIFTTGQDGGEVGIEVPGFTNNDLVMLDITDRRRPKAVRLGAANLVNNAGVYTISVQVPQGPSERRVFHANRRTQIDRVATGRIERVSTPVLTEAMSPTQAMAIGPGQFENTMQPWLDWRRGQDIYGWSYEFVDVQHIYDQFGGGLKSPWAIKRFLEFAHVVWDARAVLLAGDANEDARGILGLGTEDHVPSSYHMQKYVDWEVLASDKWYVIFPANELEEQQLDQGYPSQLRRGPDMMIGRMPAQDAAQLANMVNKVIVYEQPRLTHGWRRRALWISDDPYSTNYLAGPSAGNYLRWSNELLFRTIQDSLSNVTNRFLDGVMDSEGWALDDYTEPLRGGSENSYDISVLFNVRQAVLDEVSPRLKQDMQPGGLIVSYQGHANYNVLAHESLFVRDTATDAVTQIGNDDRPFLFFGMGCHVSDFIHFRELARGRSIGEHMMAHPRRGAIATYGSSGFEFLNPNAAFMMHIGNVWFDVYGTNAAVLDDDAPRWVLGEILARAEHTIFDVWNSLTGEMVSQYNLLGDPLLRMDAAPPRMAATADGVDLGTLTDLLPASGERTVTLEFSVTDESGVDRIAVSDGETDFTGLVQYTDGPSPDPRQRTATLELPIWPMGFPDGYDVVVSAYDRAYPRAPSDPADETAWRALRIVHVPFDLSLTINDEAFDPGQGRPITDELAELVFEFTSPIALIESEIEVETQGTALVGSLQTTQIDGEGRQWRLEFGLVSNASGEEQTVTLRLAGAPTLISLGGVAQALDLSIGSHFVFPNPVDPGAGPVRVVAEVTAPVEWARLTVYDVSGRMVRSLVDDGVGVSGRLEIVLEWDGRDQRGDEIANGTYLYRLEVGGDGTQVRSGDMGRLVVMR